MFQHIIKPSIIRWVTDRAIDKAASNVQHKGELALEEINTRARRNLAISAILNSALLLCALLVVIFIPVMKSAGLLAASIINYVILARAFFSILRFVRTVLVPYRAVIRFVIPVFAAALKERKPLESAIRISIIAVTRYFYEDKVSHPVKLVHKIASFFGLVKNHSEIGIYAADVFYPLVCRFLRTILFNILLFTVCCSVLIFITKYFLFRYALGIGMLDLWVYPFSFIMGLIYRGAE